MPKKKRQNVSTANITRECSQTSPQIEEVHAPADTIKTSTDTGVALQTKDDANASSTKRGRGRPLGSKNKKTLEREAAMANQPQQIKRGRGRPKGSKNKKTLEREAAMANQPQQIKRGRGRPKGSKNKKTLEREEKLRAASVKETQGQEVS